MKFPRFTGTGALIFVLSFASTVCLSSAPTRAVSITAGSGSGSGSGAVAGDNIEAIVQFNEPPRDGASGCTWRPALSISNGAHNAIEAINVIGVDGVRRSLYARFCNDTMQGYDWVRDDAAPRTGSVIRNKLSKLLNMLLTKTAPPLDRQVVNVGTWFWVPQSVWKPVSVTAYIELEFVVIRVTTTATPRVLTFSPGDGHAAVSCLGPGPSWNASFGDHAVSPCMYTFRSASHTVASGRYNSRMSITWNISWSSNLGISGKLPNVTTGLNNSSRVFELQALAN